MQTVTTAWKENQTQNFVNESFVELTMHVGDPAVIGEGTVTTNGEEVFSQAQTVVEEAIKEPLKYASLEANLWTLDGSLTLLPDSAPYGRNGYIGTWLSGDDGTFNPVPTITIQYSKVFEPLVPGITVTWAGAYDEYADTFSVTVYRGTTEVTSKMVTGNHDVVSIVALDNFENYDKIVIKVLKWCLPHRRARISDIVVGYDTTYTKSDIMSFSHTMSVDPLSAELPLSEISFSISNVDGRYNPDNPKGVEMYLMERQKINVRYGYKLGNNVEWIPGGVFFLSEWDMPQNGIQAGFTARDSIELMSDIYAGPVTGSLYDVVLAGLEQADLPLMKDGSHPWSVDSSLQSITLPADIELDKDTTIAMVLQYAANAGCCVLYQDRSGVMQIKPLVAGGVLDYRIDRFNSYQNSEITLTKQLKAVDINDGQYVLNVNSIGDSQPVDNPFISTTRAQTVAQWVANMLVHRKLLSGNFRADPRLDPLDRVTNENQFSTSQVLVTEVNYTYNGAFRGSYTGRQGA